MEQFSFDENVYEIFACAQHNTEQLGKLKQIPIINI